MRLFNSLTKRAFHFIGADIRHFRNTEEGILRELLRMTHPAAVLDVGANTGQYGQLVRRNGYVGSIISFEPLEEAHASLLRHAAKDKRWLVAPRMALGCEVGTVEINVAANSVSSSILAMTETHLSAAPHSRFMNKETVQMQRLDSVTLDLFPNAGDFFLKIDTQGFEREVLKGASGLMPRITAMQLELSLVPLYGQAPSFTEIIGAVDDLGFEIYQLIPGFRDNSSGRLLQVDGIFVRRKEPSESAAC